MSRKIIIVALLRFTVLVVVAAVACAVFAKPDRAPERLPDLAGDTNWGKIDQDGRKLAVSGHDEWEAEQGEIRKDGKVYLLWTRKSDGKRAHGVYRVDGRDLVGHWGFGDEADLDGDGELVGSRNAERIYHLEIKPGR